MSQSPATVATGEIVVGLLGPILIRRQSAEIPINGPRQRDLLAILATQPGRLVSTESLVDQVWHGAPPPTAASAVRVHLARIRKILADLSDGSALLLFQPPGYRLHSSVTSDAAEYERMVNQARALINEHDHRTASELLIAAERLWRGPALSGAQDVESLRIEAERLEGLRLDAQEDWADVRLALGHHGAMCSALGAAVGRAPLRERRTAQLMLALHRSGRQADALKACRRLRRTLVEELGVEPGTTVQRLEGSILRNDPGLLWRAVSGSSEPAAPPQVRPPVSDRVDGAVLEVPQLIRALATERVARLGPDARRLVGCLAVLEGQSTVEVLAAAMNRDPAAIAAMVEQGYAVGGLFTRVVAPGTVAFAHEKFADVIRAELSDTDSAELHLIVARALQRISPGANPQRVARYFLAAGSSAPLADLTRAVVLGADQALRLRDADEAAELARRALNRMADHPGLEAESIDLLLRLISAESMRGRVEEAQFQWIRAIELARRIDDAERFALVVLAHDWSQQIIGQDGGDLGLLGEALDRLPDTPSALRIRIGSALLAEAMLPGREVVELGDLAAEVDAGSRAVGDDAALLAALSAQQVLLRRLPAGPELRELTSEFRAVSERHGDEFWSANADLAVLYLALREGAATEIDRALDRFRKQVVRAGSGRLTWALSLSECCVAGMRGDVERADQFADEAAVKGAAAGISDALPATLIHRFLTDFHTSSVAAHLPLLQSMMQAYPGFSLVLAGATLSAVQAGMYRDATVLLDQLVDRLETGPRDEAFLMSTAIAAEAARQLPEQTGPRVRIRRLLVPYREEFVVFGQIAGVFGPVVRHLAVLDIADAPDETQLQMLRVARRQSKRAGSPIWVLRCAADSVRLLEALGREQDAEQLAARVRPKALALGLSADLLRGPVTRVQPGSTIS